MIPQRGDHSFGRLIGNQPDIDPRDGLVRDDRLDPGAHIAAVEPVDVEVWLEHGPAPRFRVGARGKPIEAQLREERVPVQR